MGHFFGTDPQTEKVSYRSSFPELEKLTLLRSSEQIKMVQLKSASITYMDAANHWILSQNLNAPRAMMFWNLVSSDVAVIVAKGTRKNIEDNFKLATLNIRNVVTNILVVDPFTRTSRQWKKMSSSPKNCLLLTMKIQFKNYQDIWKASRQEQMPDF